MDYLRYFLPSFVIITTGLSVLAGGPWVWTGLALFAVMAVPDILMGFDFTARRMSTAGALFMLYIQAIPITFLWVAYWIFVSRHPGTLEVAGAMISMAIITAAVGLPIAHEMFHRSETLSRFLGGLFSNLFLASYLELEHNKSHHVETSSALDVDTPRRGESVYPFALRLFIYFHKHGFQQEQRRMQAYGKSVWLSPSSRIFWQAAGGVALLAVFYFADGWRSVLIAAMTAMLGSAIITVFSYVQHYGLQRVPGTPIEKRHAWNHIRPVSRMLTFEIVTHSQHHIDPTTPYWKLPAFRDAPLVGSAIGFFFLSLVPPLWHRAMRPHLARWDAEFADPAEKALAQQANKAAGWGD
nr:D435 [uncultured bacterium]